MTFRIDSVLNRVNPNARPPDAARFIAAVLALVALTLTGCSAVTLRQEMATATAEADALATAATDNPTVVVLHAAQAELQSTAAAYSAGATQAADTITALELTLTSAPGPTEVLPDPDTFDPSSAETSVYGEVPIDSDRLNIIAALAFDIDGQLLVATRAGEIYLMPDSDGDGIADETRLIFADEEQQLAQVSGLIARGDSLILLNGERLSLLLDADSDGEYETVTQLSQQRQPTKAHCKRAMASCERPTDVCSQRTLIRAVSCASSFATSRSPQNTQPISTSHASCHHAKFCDILSRALRTVTSITSHHTESRESRIPSAMERVLPWT